MKNVFLFCLVLMASTLIAQDDYHQALQDLFKDDYGLPTGTWVLHDNEEAIMGGAAVYNVGNTNLEITDKDFTKAKRFNITAQANPWDAGFNISNKVAVAQGEKVLVTFWIRAEEGGEVSVFAEDGTTFTKQFYININPTDEWRQFFIPFESDPGFSTGQMNMGFHLGNETQTIEMGGFTCVKFPAAIPLNQLPNKTGAEFYQGFEEDAAWRTPAADRIDQLRKANLNILVKKTDGTLQEGAEVRVEMLQHEFGFGSAITAARIAGNNDQNFIYEDKIINLDGKGHGFNCVVYENDMKWRGWESTWFVTNAELANSVQWLREKNIKIRGHNLIWPGSSYLPSDVVNNLDNPTFVKNRINERIEEIMNYDGMKGEIEEWDILNEIAVNRDFENTFKGQPGYPTGREIYHDIYKKAREEDPNTGLWINDYVTLSLKAKPGNVNYDNLKKFTGEIVDAGVELEGIGFQGHIGGSLNGINDVLETFDDFYNAFGLKAKITEFDIDAFVEEELAGTYLRDFMTAMFSHPSMDGFLMWGFWDGAHWKNNAPMYNADWSIKPAGEAFIDMVFDQWWTDEKATTTSDGTATVRGFKGMYKISYFVNGEEVSEVVNLTEDIDYEIISDELPTNTKNIKRLPIQVYPNPSTGLIQIEAPTDEEAQITIYNLTGQQIRAYNTSSVKSTLDLSDLKGLYLLEFKTKEGRFVEKLSLF